MLNKTNILVIFILFTIGCVNLPETTAEKVEESPTATIDIDATVMAMFEASNSNETVKKDPPADTQVNITSANAEQAVSVNTEATMDAFSNKLQGTSVPDTSISEGSNSKVSAPVYEYPTADPSLPTATPRPYPQEYQVHEIWCPETRQSDNIPSILLRGPKGCMSKYGWSGKNSFVDIEWDVELRRVEEYGETRDKHILYGTLNNDSGVTQDVTIKWVIYDEDGFLYSSEVLYMPPPMRPGAKIRFSKSLVSGFQEPITSISEIELIQFTTR